MAETLLTARTRTRLLAVDTDSFEPALTDAEWNLLINGAYLDYARTFPEQFSVSATSPLATITLSTGVMIYLLTTASGVIEWTGATNHSDASTPVSPLDRSDFSELYRLATVEGNASSTYPSRWAVRRITDTQHQFVVYPSPASLVNGKFVYVWGYKEPAQLGSDSSTFPYIADSEVLWISRLAAIRGAGVIGRDQQFIDQLWSDLPQKMQLTMRKVESFKRPYPKQAEVET